MTMKEVQRRLNTNFTFTDDHEGSPTSVKDRLGYLQVTMKEVPRRLNTDLTTYSDHEGSPMTPRYQVG
jgi:hypothetical protein